MQTLSRWTVVFLLGFVALLAISEVLWLWQSWPVRQVLQNGNITGTESSK
jgi:type VI secretion system protein ImpK